MWLLFLLACAPEVAPAAVEAPVAEISVVAPAPLPPPVWPAREVTLANLDVALPEGWTDRRIVIDAGHGAPGNPGATSSRCEAEQDSTRRLADAVVPRIGEGFAVRAARPDASLVSYTSRIRAAEKWKAHAMIGLHFDARAGVDTRMVDGCPVTDGAAGFAVLWSDEGDADLVDKRQRLARAIADRMVEAGFLAYDGVDYGVYEGDPDHPGVFVDRHAPKQRIMMLRKTRVPTVIVETHEGWDPAEVERWEEPATHDAFAGALRAAFIDVL